MSHLTLDYGLMVKNLFRPSEEILEGLTPLKIDLWHAASGVAGEGGEVLDEVKKLCAYGREIDQQFLDKICKEMGDIEFYMEALRQKLGITRGEILAMNMDKLSERYPGMVFTREAANARVDMRVNESGRLELTQKENDES